MPVSRIITAIDYALAEGAGQSVKARILKLRDSIRASRGITLDIINIDNPSGDIVYARIWQGQWIADCPTCRAAQFVAPQEPIFFCFGCGNRRNGNAVMQVVFPEPFLRKQIETALLDRPVDDSAGLTELEQVGLSRPLVYAQVEKDGRISTLGLSRDWNPDETLDELLDQNKAIEAWRLKNGI